MHSTRIALQCLHRIVEIGIEVTYRSVIQIMVSQFSDLPEGR